jgi:transcription-repair coupling factor (superfamily II helicase)
VDLSGLFTMSQRCGRKIGEGEPMRWLDGGRTERRGNVWAIPFFFPGHIIQAEAVFDELNPSHHGRKRSRFGCRRAEPIVPRQENGLAAEGPAVQSGGQHSDGWQPRSGAPVAFRRWNALANRSPLIVSSSADDAAAQPGKTRSGKAKTARPAAWSTSSSSHALGGPLPSGNNTGIAPSAGITATTVAEATISVDEPSASSMSLGRLAERLKQHPGWDEVIRALRQAQPVSVDGAWGSASALTVAALSADAAGPLLVILPREKDLDEFALDVASFSGHTPAIFPSWETLPDELRLGDPILGTRLRVLLALESSQPPSLLLTSITALMQPVPGRAVRQAGTRTFRRGDELSMDEVCDWLLARGFERVAAIESPGEFSLHGGIFDIFSPHASDPVRMELFGDEIDSLRTFSVETQQKIAELEQVTITVVAAPLGPAATRSAERQPLLPDPDRDLRVTGESLLDSLPSQTWVVLSELEELTSEGRHYLDRLDDPRGLFSVEATLERAARHPMVTLAAIAAATANTHLSLRVQSLERLTGAKANALQELAGLLDTDTQVLLACHNAGALERLQELLAEAASGLKDRITLCQGTMARGFRLPPLRSASELVSASETADALSESLPALIVLSDNQLFSRTTVPRAPRKARVEGRAIDSFLDLAEGDLIVHLSHGLGRYRGMKLLEKDGVREEHLHLEFREGMMMFVPVSLIHLVQKYVGGGKTAPELGKPGGTAWAKKKQKVAEAVSDMAADMLRLQAQRELRRGFACPPDSHWQQEFDAAFPYTETEDQLHAIADSKQDMQRPQPMDRLICGDVGYGKTEVAMRAAFKAVDAGKQVAVLVPTTILAEQHFRSFSERMAEFPVSIASLSRFKTKAEQRETLAGLAEGTIDIVIGTHRLISPDVQFKDLGLLVIDEEQRFGVEAKELLKRLRLEVDVLTLSATPIPRTLHLSLLGVRDISNLETPPQDRQAVETRVCRFDPELIRHALVRELNRNGQAYFVHNQVYNIQSVADRITSIVPEARVGIIHGQMKEEELEPTMLGFVRGEIDVLVATTIIESGLDIPNANTMFIHQADNYGLADLHQLRGRVGRYKHRAYCYLMLEEGKTLTPTASRRLKAIEEFSDLGAGFKIALRDLEIRGAGNILGTEQSGHIAAVGYELYCQLLENAVRAIKGEPLRQPRHVAVDLPISGFIPPEYVPPGRAKIEMYRKLSAVPNVEQLKALREEFRDRFGPLPPEVETLLTIRDLQIAAARWSIDEIRLEDSYAVFGYRNHRKLQKLVKRSPFPLRIVDQRSAYLVLPPGIHLQTDLIPCLKSVLQESPDENYVPPSATSHRQSVQP